MQVHPWILTGLLALAGLPACGDAGDSDAKAATGDDVAAYRQFMQDVQSTAAGYETAMMGDQITTVAACQQVHDEYDAHVRVRLENMAEMSGRLDVFMYQHGGGGMADVGCATAGMSSELDQHRLLACRSADLAADRAEAVRHVDVMSNYALHMTERSDQMMGTILGHPSEWGPMMVGCEGWEGRMRMHR